MSKFVIPLLFFWLCSHAMLGQSPAMYRISLPWKQSLPESIRHEASFAEHPLYRGIPVFIFEKETNPVSLAGFAMQSAKTEKVSLPDSLTRHISNTSFLQDVIIVEQRGQYTLRATILPLRKLEDGSIEKLHDATLTCSFQPLITSANRSVQASKSVLAEGTIFKIAVTQSGIHKIDKAFLETRLGLTTTGLDPAKIRVYGGRGGRLPEANAAPRLDDLEELAIKVTGSEDGRLDAADAILFYAEGPDIWKYEPTTKSFTFDKNIYDNNNYYYLIINGENGLRITSQQSITDSPDYTTSSWERLQRLEEDKVNLLGSFIGAEGTGKDWYGDYFSGASREKILTQRFDLQNIIAGEPVELEFAFAGRSKSTTSLALTLGAKTITRTINSVNTLDQESLYARRIKYTESYVPATSLSDMKLTYPAAGTEAEGWLDYLQLIHSEKSQFTSGQHAFRNRKSSPWNLAAMTIENTTGYEIWDVTNPLQPVQQPLTGTTLVFRPQGIVREFIAFKGLDAAYVPTFVGKVPNQNLHGLSETDMLIVYHPLFEKAAKKLAEHREARSGIQVDAVETTAVYNEFSSGKADPSAIRDLAKMLLDRNPTYKYLLLFGDGSYDYKGLVKELPADNFVPAYQTDESLHPIDGFPSDDFYGLLGPTEGVNLAGELDIYVGRLPARTAAEADILVEKIIHYETAPECLGDWRLRTGYVADDEDGNTHLRDMDDIARQDADRHAQMNQQKVYIDAYRQVSTPGENRYPDANKAIFDNIFKGQLTLTYLGHGGPLGWAQERILTVPEMQSWTNRNQLPVMITATCSFGAYDEPAVVSPAEYALSNPKGGAIALMTTTRAVYTNSNKQLTDAVHEVLYKLINGKAPTLGYAMTQGKNKYKLSFFVVNSRKFTLLGDPSLAIALPSLEIKTTHVNGKEAQALSDTLRALEKVVVEGFIAGPDGNIASGFQGTIFPTVYDKKTTQKTLANDEASSPYEFDVYRNILFKGAASVINGKWSFAFWVPKNINYSIGNSRISYYATNGTDLDAAGHFDNLLLGGSSDNPVSDEEGPDMQLYMNDLTFRDGGLTSSNPVLLITLQDDLGIDVTGNAIGQDITAVLDGNTKLQFILNDFYKAETDDFTRGIVRFPLTNLTPGLHTITAKAWDISGNPTTGELRFLVAGTDVSQLENARCVPNPFTDQVAFEFEHDLAGQNINIGIEIYDATGKCVKKHTSTQYSAGFRVNDITWEGRDLFEEGLARGVYFCKLTVKAADGSQLRESRFLKIVKM